MATAIEANVDDEAAQGSTGEDGVEGLIEALERVGVAFGISVIEEVRDAEIAEGFTDDSELKTAFAEAAQPVMNVFGFDE